MIPSRELVAPANLPSPPGSHSLIPFPPPTPTPSFHFPLLHILVAIPVLHDLSSALLAHAALPYSDLFSLVLSLHTYPCSDLLEPTQAPRIRESAERGMFVENLLQVQLRSAKEALRTLARGAANRNTASTVMNATSSRSHAVFIIRVEQVTPASAKSRRGGKCAEHVCGSSLSLVDLAGSERQQRSPAEDEPPATAAAGGDGGVGDPAKGVRPAWLHKNGEQPATPKTGSATRRKRVHSLSKLRESRETLFSRDDDDDNAAEELTNSHSSTLSGTHSSGGTTSSSMLSPRRFLCNTDAAHAFDACSDTGSEFDCEEQIDGQVVSACSTARSSSTRSQSAQSVRPPESSNRTHAVLARAGGAGGWDMLRKATQSRSVRELRSASTPAAAPSRPDHTARLQEACCINRSLSALSNVILSLNEGRSYTPYRDSKLTLLLRDSVGGSARTWMVATVSPLESCKTESLNTIMFASRAAKVKNKVVRQAVQLVEVDDPVVPPPIVPPPAPPPAPQVCHECERLEQLVGEKDGAIRTLSEKLRADSTEFARAQRATKEECACALQLVEASKADALARAASEHERERAEQHDKMMREMAAAEDAAAAALRKAMQDAEEAQAAALRRAKEGADARMSAALEEADSARNDALRRAREAAEAEMAECVRKADEAARTAAATLARAMEEAEKAQAAALKAAKETADARMSAALEEADKAHREALKEANDEAAAKLAESICWRTDSLRMADEAAKVELKAALAEQWARAEAEREHEKAAAAARLAAEQTASAEAVAKAAEAAAAARAALEELATDRQSSAAERRLMAAETEAKTASDAAAAARELGALKKENRRLAAAQAEAQGKLEAMEASRTREVEEAVALAVEEATEGCAKAYEAERAAEAARIQSVRAAEEARLKLECDESISAVQKQLKQALLEAEQERSRADQAQARAESSESVAAAERQAWDQAMVDAREESGRLRAQLAKAIEERSEAERRQHAAEEQAHAGFHKQQSLRAREAREAEEMARRHEEAMAQKFDASEAARRCHAAEARAKEEELTKLKRDLAELYAALEEARAGWADATKQNRQLAQALEGVRAKAVQAAAQSRAVAEAEKRAAREAADGAAATAARQADMQMEREEALRRELTAAAEREAERVKVLERTLEAAAAREKDKERALAAALESAAATEEEKAKLAAAAAAAEADKAAALASVASASEAYKSSVVNPAVAMAERAMSAACHVAAQARAGLAKEHVKMEQQMTEALRRLEEAEMVRDEQTKQATRQAAERAWNSVVRQPALEEHHATLEAHMRRIKQLDDEGREIAAKHERKLEEEQAWRIDGFVDEARDWRDAQMRAQGRFLHLR